MTVAEVVDRHIRDQRFYLDSLTREERKQDRRYVIEIAAARYVRRVRAALALANVRIEAKCAETSSVLSLLDAKDAALARGD